MITLLLFGGSILLWVVLHWVNRTRRSRTNPYDRFLKERRIDEVRLEDQRTYKLRVATHEAKLASAGIARPADAPASPEHARESE